MNKFVENYKKIILTLVFSFAIFLILFHFTNTPKVWVDEGIFTNAAESVADGGVLGMQTNPGEYFRLGPQLTVNYPVVYMVAISLKLFGHGIWQSRLPMLLYMLMLVIAFYLFTKKRHGLYPAILSVLLLISFSPFYGNGRPVQGEIAGLVFLVFGALFLTMLEEEDFQSKKLSLLSGLMFGLASATKPIYFLGLSVVLFVTLLFWFKKIKNKKNILFFIVSLLTPMLVWFFVNFPTRELQSQIIPTIIKQAGNNGASSLSGTSLSPIQNILTNFLRFFTESTPILFTLLSLVVFFFFLSKLFKKDDSKFSISEFVILGFIVINFCGYLVGTGWYRYFFPAHTLLYLMFPVAFLGLVRYFKNNFIKNAIFILPFFLILFQFYHLIFISDTALIRTHAKNTVLENTLFTIPNTKKVLFYNSPEAVVFLKHNNFSQYLLMPGLFEAGDKNFTLNPTFDYMLVAITSDNANLVISCYDKKTVDEYFLFAKIDSCKK